HRSSLDVLLEGLALTQARKPALEMQKCGAVATEMEISVCHDTERNISDRKLLSGNETMCAQPSVQYSHDGACLSQRLHCNGRIAPLARSPLKLNDSWCNRG